MNRKRSVAPLVIWSSVVDVNVWPIFVNVCLMWGGEVFVSDKSEVYRSQKLGVSNLLSRNVTLAGGADLSPLQQSLCSLCSTLGCLAQAQCRHLDYCIIV
jgi:hypothetical protein